nr:MAG TPA: hypothetical protein [Caudoviricetes sp.]
MLLLSHNKGRATTQALYISIAVLRNAKQISGGQRL